MANEAAAFGPETRVQPRRYFLTVSSSVPLYSPWRFTPQSKAFDLPHIQINWGPWPYQWSLGRHFHKIQKRGNICKLHGSIKDYKNVMKHQEFLKAPVLRFFKYYWSATNLHSRENKNLEFLQSVSILHGNHTKLWCMGICVVFLKSLCFNL